MIHLFHINNVTIHNSCPRTVSVVVVLLYSVDFLIFSYLLLSVWGGKNFKYPETLNPVLRMCTLLTLKCFSNNNNLK